MNQVTYESAVELARIAVERLAAKSDDTFELLLDETKEIPIGWVFFYNSADYARTRNPIDALAGNGPLLVVRSGRIIEMPSSIPWEESVRTI